MKMTRKIGYSFGDLGISISYFIVGFFFLYYLTDILGITPWLAGTVVFIGKVWEGIANPLIGVFNDRVRSAFGAKRLFILFGAVPFALSFILLWLIPVSLDEGIKYILAVASMLIYSTAYAFVSVPYMAVVPVATKDYDERTQIIGIRGVFSTMGIILGGSVALLVSSFTDEALGLKYMAAGFGVFTAVTLVVAANSIKGLEQVSSAVTGPIKINLNQYWGLLKEKYVVILLVFKFLGAIATGCLMASIPYFAKYVLVDTGSSTYGVAIYTITAALLIPVWYKLTRSFDKRRLLLIANSLGAVILLGVGLLVQEGSTLLFFAGCGLLGVIMSAYLLIPYSFVPDLVDYYAHKNGVRHEAVYFGSWMTIHQIGIATSGLLLGIFLGAFGYDGTLEVQTPAAIVAVRLAFGLIPGVFLILAALVLQKYGITRKVYLDVQAGLANQS